MFNDWKKSYGVGLLRFYKEINGKFITISGALLASLCFVKIMERDLFLGFILVVMFVVLLLSFEKDFSLYSVWLMSGRNGRIKTYYVHRQDDIVPYAAIVGILSYRLLVGLFFVLGVVYGLCSEVFLCALVCLFMLGILGFSLIYKPNLETKRAVCLSPVVCLVSAALVFLCYLLAVVSSGAVGSGLKTVGLLISLFAVVANFLPLTYRWKNLEKNFLFKEITIDNWKAHYDYKEVDDFIQKKYKDVGVKIFKKFSVYSKSLRNVFDLSEKKAKLEFEVNSNFVTSFLVEKTTKKEPEGEVVIYANGKEILARPVKSFSRGWNTFKDLIDNNKTNDVIKIRVESTVENAELFMQCPYELKEQEDLKTIIVLLVDALSKEFVGAYGGPDTRTPNIDNFFKDATVYDNAWAQGEWTTSNFMHMFTSLYSSHHKLVNRCDGYKPLLDRSIKTVADRFQESGWNTFMFSGSQRVSQSSGYDQGFSLVSVFPYTNVMNWDEIYPVIDVLETYKKQNNFIFIHLNDVHGPPVFWSHMLNNEAQFRKVNRKNIFRSLYPEEFFKLNRNQVEEFDVGISFLLSYLNRPELKDNTAVVLTADHGQMSAPQKEDPISQKEVLLSKRMINVLLMLKCSWLPELNGRRFDGLVESGIDLYPTLLDMAGIESKHSLYAKSFLAKNEREFKGKDFVVTESIYEGVVQQVVRKIDSVYYFKFGWREQNIEDEDVWTIKEGQYYCVEEAKRNKTIEEFRKIIAELDLVKIGDDPIDFYGSY